LGLILLFLHYVVTLLECDTAWSWIGANGACGCLHTNNKFRPYLWQHCINRTRVCSWFWSYVFSINFFTSCCLVQFFVAMYL